MRVKEPSLLISWSIQVALARGAFAAVDTGAAAQKNDQISQINISASRDVKRETAGRTYTGIPIEQVELTRRVGRYVSLQITR